MAIEYGWRIRTSKVNLENAAAVAGCIQHFAAIGCVEQSSVAVANICHPPVVGINGNDIDLACPLWTATKYAA